MMKWRPLKRTHCPEALRPWLSAQDSLTARLSALAGAPIRVEVQREGYAPPLPWERAALALNAQTVGWRREVLLYHPLRPQPMLQARTFVPRWHRADNPWRRIARLGARPLGEWLFQLENVQRRPPRVARTHASQWPGCAGRWARYTVWRQAGWPLILTEVFLFHERYAG